MAVYLCCTCPEVAFGGCYPLSCPIKPGLSSYTAFRHCARGCSAYSDFYYTQSILPLSTSVTLDPFLSPAPCVVCLLAPALASQHRQGPGCSPGPVPQKRMVVCRRAKTGTTAGSPRPARERSTTAQALGVDIGGRSVTIEGVMFFSENHRQACLPKGMIK